MKRTVVIFLFWALNYCNAQDYWLQQPSPTTRWLTRIQFVDTLFGWASGDSGTIIHTSNGGADWVLQNSGQNSYFIDDLFFLNRTTGWALWNDYLFISGTAVLKTTDGGTNWNTSYFPDSNVIINCIYFLNEQTGFAGGNYPGRLFKTTDGGVNWTESRIDTSSCQFYLFPKNNINFLNALTGFACGGQIDLGGMIWKTTDGGLNWLTFCIAPEPLERIKPLSADRIITSGGDLEFGASTVFSNDSGKSWRYRLIGPSFDTSFFGVGMSLAYRTPAEVWVPLAFGQAWGVSLDSGNFESPWFYVPAAGNNSVYDAVFAAPTFGYACGYDGILLKYNPAVIGILVKQKNIPGTSILFQNYPNPFNPVTTISYYLLKNALVRVTVYDLLGKVVYSSIEGYKQEGLHKFRFSSGSISSGVYFYTVSAGDWTESKKMVILK